MHIDFNHDGLLTDVLFFTRGRGRGHAVRDLAIAQQLRVLNPAVKLAFASYDLGYATFIESGEFAHDLRFEERNPFPATVVRAAALIKSLMPRLVVAQEEPAALVAAAVCDIKALFTTSWFSRSSNERYQALEYAHRILFMEEPGLFLVPQELKARVHYCGPVLRPMNSDPAAASVFRSALGLSPKHTLITVLPGSPPEAREPIFDLVVEAFSLLKSSTRHLLWVAGKDIEYLAKRVSCCENIHILKNTDEMDAIILASQVLITKGTYNIGREIMALGRPSISLSHAHNWIDDFFAAQWPNNTSLRVEQTTAGGLASRIEYLLQRPAELNVRIELLTGAGVRCAAEAIIAELP